MKAQFSYILLLLSMITLAQQPLNLDFERKSIEGAARPWGWSSPTWGTTFVMDSTTVKEGAYSLHSTYAETTKPGFLQVIEFEMEPFELKSKTLLISGFIKGHDLGIAASFSLAYWLYDEETGAYIEEEIVIESERLSGSFDWQNLSVQAKVPENVLRMRVRMSQEGLGEAWFDGFQLYVDGKEYQELQITAPFSEEQINWFADNSNSFNSPMPISKENDFQKEDLSFFKKAVGESKIIALGESTHGTSEFFSLKHKLFQYAVTQLGFRVFALEDHQIFGENINRYVQTGIGTLEESMAGCFDVWNRVEVVKLIEWIRAFNIEHPDDMISFIGFDIQNITPSMEKLSQFLKKQDPIFYSERIAELKDLKDKGVNAFMIRDSVKQLENIEQSKKLFNEVASQRTAWLLQAKTKADTLAIEYGIQYANLVRQYFQMMLNNDDDLYRDIAMNDNLLWYIKNKYPKEKIVIWAHDVHISRGDHPQTSHNLHRSASMGSFLSKRYKDDYKSFGISTHNGTYRAFKTYSYQTQIESPLFESPKGSLEEAMHQVAVIKKKPNLFFKMSRDHDWLNKLIPIRFANHVSFDYGFWSRYSIPYQFDGVFFIDETTSAIPTKD